MCGTTVWHDSKGRAKEQTSYRAGWKDSKGADALSQNWEGKYAEKLTRNMSKRNLSLAASADFFFFSLQIIVGYWSWWS